MTDQRLSTFLWLLLAVSGTANVVLSLKVVSLERVLHPNPRIRAGTRLEDVVGMDPNGHPLTIHFADSRNPTILLILRPGCQWCDQNMPNWQALVRGKSNDFRFVAVSLSALDFKPYLEANKLALPAIFPSFEKNPTLSGVTATPQTIVVGPDQVPSRVTVLLGRFNFVGQAPRPLRRNAHHPV